MDINSFCYDFKKYNYPYGILNNCIDATYVIYLKNNGRQQSIYNQLEKYKPSSVVYIVENSGFKNCKKNLIKQTTTYDLFDAYYNILKHADKMNYNNILILEDDFIFNDLIKDKDTISGIDKFLKKKQDENFIYYLGCLPYFKISLFSDSQRLLLSSTSHACIYSKKFRKFLLKKDLTYKNDWDLYLNLNCAFQINKYCYKKPLCYQIFEETENQKNWPEYFGLKTLYICLFKFLQLDKHPEPGFSVFYNVSDIVSYIIIILIIYYLIKQFKLI